MAKNDFALLFFLLVIQLTAVIGNSGDNINDEEELVKIVPGQSDGEENPRTAAEQYVDFLENGGKVVQEEQESDAVDDGDNANEKDEYDYESETLDFLLKQYFAQFQDINTETGKKKLEEHIEEMDSNKNGVISKEELTQWLIAEGEKGATSEAMALDGITMFDSDKDGKLDWDEVYEDLKKLGSLENEEFKKGIETEKARFAAADKNKDKFLDELEYARYATPEYFTEMANYTIQSYIADFDQNQDMKISREEFLRGFDKIKDRDGYEVESKKFDEMDKNEDGFLTPDEVSTVALAFTINNFADKRVKNLFFHADADKNGELSKSEIVANYALFTKGLPDEFSEADYKHDEL